MVRRPIRQERGPRRALRKPRRPRILKGVLHVHDVYSAWSGIDDRRRRADLHRTRRTAVKPTPTMKEGTSVVDAQAARGEGVMT